jgi:Ca2+-binding RTX toxin-like protein
MNPDHGGNVMAEAGYNVITGTHGDDDLTGTSGNDYFKVQQGGDDTLSGLDGNDIFAFRDAFNANDTVDGGNGNDILRLTGDAYGDGLTIGAGSLTSVEEIQFGAGHFYNVTSNDGNVAAGQQLIVNAVTLQAGDGLIFNGAAETDGSFKLVGGAGDDTLTGGAGNDIFALRMGGSDVAHGGGGDDIFFMGGALDAADQIDGGTGSDTVVLAGIDVSDSLTLSATSLTSVEKLLLQGGFNYGLTENDANVAAHATMTVEDHSVDSADTLFFDGSAETDGHFVFKPGDATATLIGGAMADRFDLSGGASDTITGGGGPDMIVAGVSDTFIYNAASDSTSTHYDTIQNVNFNTDTFIAPWGTASVFASFAGGSISTATFDSDLTAAVGPLAAHGAAVYTATAGTLSGHSFLVIDVNGTVGYQAGADLVIDVTGFTGLDK